MSNYQGQMSKLFIGKAITHTLRSWQNSSPGKNFSCIGWKAKLFPWVEFSFFAEARGLVIFSQVTISICWSVIRNKQAAEICHKEHNCSIGARRSSRSQNPDPSPIKNLELTPSKNRGGKNASWAISLSTLHLLCPHKQKKSRLRRGCLWGLLIDFYLN